MSDIKGNNTNSTGFQVLEFSNCSSPCPHQALLVHFGEDQRGWWILSLTLSRGCVVIPDPDPHLCGCFSWNNQIPISEQIYSVKWTFLELKIQTKESLKFVLAAVCLAARLCDSDGEGPLLQVRETPPSPFSALFAHGDGQRLDSENRGFPVDVSVQPARDEFHWKHCEGFCSLLQGRALFYPLILPFNRL